MLHENLKQLRKTKGMTQEELALQLNVVRQTVSKWEKGLSVPDSDMLVEISERFDVPVSTLLGETIELSEKEDSIKIISDKLAVINEQLAKNAERKRRWVRGGSFIGIAGIACYVIWQIAAKIYLYTFPYYNEKTSTSIIGGADAPTSIFVESSGINITSIIVVVGILLVSVCGICLTRRK